MSKIVDREGLKAFRERLDEKYVIEGEYSPQTTVGLADNFTPYSEDSGAEQSNPFISNGTGTNNNQEIVTVGDYGLLKSKNGNTVVVNQYNNATNNTYSENGITFERTQSSSKVKISGLATANASAWAYSSIIRALAGHKVLLRFKDCPIGVSFNNYNITITKSSIITANASGTYGFMVANGTDLSGNNYYETHFEIIDLTQWFNGDIPQDILDNPSHFSWYYNGDLSYNTGTLVNANGVKLVSTGRNLFDEETTDGFWDTTGANDNSSFIRNKNAIPVIEGVTYYIKAPTTAGSLYTKFYADETLTNGFMPIVITKNSPFVVPQGAKYFGFAFQKSSYGNTYNHDITISLYYTSEQGGEGYDKYYAYEAPYEVDTGSEVLRSAGSVKDTKKPSGEITRNVGTYTFTGNETWTGASSNRFSCSILQGLAKGYEGNVVSQFITNTKYSATSRDNNPNIDNSICIGGTGTIIIKDTSVNETSLASYMAGKTIYYELLEPTTEQGTSFAENLPINDYGMLYWDSDIPQGNTIFFPINYKGFLDDMYSRVDGDSSAYVIDTQLQASETQRDTIDTQLKNAIGGTLRQCLCVKESLDFDNTGIVDLGTLSWIWQSTQNRWLSTGLISLIKLNKSVIPAISTKYKSYSYNGMGGSDYSEIIGVCYYESSGNLFVRNGSSTEKPSGLLAYEKA